MMSNITRITRRKVLKNTGVLAAMPLWSLAGCHSDNAPTDSSTTGNPGTITGGIRWANGGTELITAAYPDDDLFDVEQACSLTLPTRTDVLGPCFYDAGNREDIAEGLPGLPMQISLKIINDNCEPVPGAQVDIWHCDHRGVYSGDTAISSSERRFNGAFCTGGDNAAQGNSWGRGGLVANDLGRVDFKSIFPGWYPGRPIHIHFTVALNGNTSLVSQLYFENSLCEEICLTHSIYVLRGAPDTIFLRTSETEASPEIKTQLFTSTVTLEGTLQVYKTIKLG